MKVPAPDFCGEDPHRGSSLWNPLLGSSRYEGPRCQENPRCLLAGGLRCWGPLLAGKLLLPGVPCCREALVGQALVGGTPGFAILGRFLWNYDKDSRFFGVPFQTSGASSSLPGGPRCREALVAGRPSLPGGPRCREALVAGRPSLPGGQLVSEGEPLQGFPLL